MSLLEVVQLVGYSTGAWLHLWMGALLVKRRRGLGKTERVLLALAISIGGWHASNLVITLITLLGLESARWSVPVRAANTVAVTSITFSYSFLLHVHLHLWANARKRPLTFTERARVYLSYIPTLFLVIALPPLWTGESVRMLESVPHLVLPFALWAAYVLTLIAITDLLIARLASSARERRFLQTLAASLITIGVLILLVHVFEVGKGTTFGLYLETVANLGSLLPTALLAYYIYRYRPLELIIRESLIVASFAAFVLVIYLFGIRTVGQWLTVRYGLRPGAVESLLILALALLAAPVRLWLDRYFHQLFGREATLYRDVVAGIGSLGGQYKQLPELLRFVEEQTKQALGLRRIRVVPYNLYASSDSGIDSHATIRVEEVSEEANGLPPWLSKLLELAKENEWTSVNDTLALQEHGYETAYALRREDRVVGVMLIDAAKDALTPDVRAVLEVLAGQVAIAIEECRLVDENVRLERRLAQGERLAALGRMAATVAHEVKNPLSAIKSIAQVMREDQSLTHEYGRDLELIVGETNRLSRSVTQLLSFARYAPPSDAPCGADELVRAVVELFNAQAKESGVRLEHQAEARCEVDGRQSAAVRDALSNLLLNALQATPAGGRVRVEAHVDGDDLLISVTDGGTGVPVHLRERIWEPFFTTKQRGTGLGLAIVRKRMEDVGGAARLATKHDGKGMRFELHLPLARVR
ncbi:MAG: hypothetical protein H0T92_08420 [Pyrinomonadaceae bacterium]|nr:hypothetical protein [Pyrinomonadaceae bacterium]